MSKSAVSEPVQIGQPQVGELVQVRSRRWLVEEVVATGKEQSPIVRLSCADDDAQGQSLEVFWDYELDRRILKEERWQDLAAKGFDLPRQFAAFLHTLRWNCVTATDPNLFQAPSRWNQNRCLPNGTAAEGASSAASEPVHCRRYQARQNNRSRLDRPRAASAKEDEDNRCRGTAVGHRAMEIRARGALRPSVRNSRSRLPDKDAPRARLRRESMADAQSFLSFAQSFDRLRLHDFQRCWYVLQSGQSVAICGIGEPHALQFLVVAIRGSNNAKFIMLLAFPRAANAMRPRNGSNLSWVFCCCQWRTCRQREYRQKAHFASAI